jgi:hypothetical protein
MVRRAMVVLCLGLMTILLASCGQTYELQSISITPDTGFDLDGLGKSGQLKVTAHYSNTKTEDVTVKSIYQVSVPQDSDPRAPLSVPGTNQGAVTVDNSGLVQNSAYFGICTWYASPTSAALSSYSYFTKPYAVTATYSGHTAQTQISVDSVEDCFDTANPAPAGYAGTDPTTGY